MTSANADTCWFDERMIEAVEKGRRAAAVFRRCGRKTAIIKDPDPAPRRIT